MSDIRSNARAAASAGASAAHASHGDDPATLLRRLGARAHQLRASVRAADVFNGQDNEADRDTAAWLVSGALAMAEELTADFDGLARATKEHGADALQLQTVSRLRVRAHQLLAATRAADRFLERETREDRETGGWLVATAFALADKLAAEADDAVLPVKRGAVKLDKASIEPHDAALMRQLSQATAA